MLTLTPQPVTALERERDQLAGRLARLVQEPARDIVEGFHYTDTAKAARVRGRLACSILRRIDAVNREICKRIAPEFRQSASMGFSGSGARDE